MHKAVGFIHYGKAVTCAGIQHQVSCRPAIIKDTGIHASPAIQRVITASAIQDIIPCPAYQQIIKI